MPMQRERYPANWEAIAHGVKYAANWTCQECGRPCRKPGVDWTEFCLWLLNQGGPEGWYAETCDEVIDEETGEWGYVERPGRSVLTVAHLDQNPANNAPSNLKALCSVCHLRHDAIAHAASRKRNRRIKQERQGQQVLNLIWGDEEVGDG